MKKLIKQFLIALNLNACERNITKYEIWDCLRTLDEHYKQLKEVSKEKEELIKDQEHNTKIVQDYTSNIIRSNLSILLHSSTVNVPSMLFLNPNMWYRVMERARHNIKQNKQVKMQKKLSSQIDKGNYYNIEKQIYQKTINLNQN